MPVNAAARRPPIFSLEALEARHGDALLLHYGSIRQPQVIVIDGGPKGVYTRTLKPRLDALRASRTPDGALPIRMVMVSHIDEDHVEGIIQLTKELLQDRGDGAPASYAITALWHNSFDDVTSAMLRSRESAAPVLRVASAESLQQLGPSVAADTGLLLASVAQGRQLRDNATMLALLVNPGFGPLVVAAEQGPRTRDIGSGLAFTVVGPRQSQVDALQKEWDQYVDARRAAGNLPSTGMEAIAAAFVDESVFNLSSIVVLARCAGRTMLLTGDARGDFIMDGLKAARLLRNDRLHVDLLKVPHHGSAHNVARSFFERITADHYVFSANGKFDNPDVETLELLLAARPTGSFTLHFTNRVPAVEAFLTRHAPAGVTVNYRADTAPSVIIDLGEPLVD
jgi:hypothetical protein